MPEIIVIATPTMKENYCAYRDIITMTFIENVFESYAKNG